ncbi:hypothetical protein BB029_12455 [Pseudomonas sp. S3E12]|nr:hypothetical protein BB029_12455 [Pseudomonas sp. S3E12]
MFKKWLIDSIYYFVKDTSISVVRNFFFIFFGADFFLKSLSFKVFRRFFSATYFMFGGGSISVR